MVFNIPVHGQLHLKILDLWLVPDDNGRKDMEY
jgi:hypothetical protein